VRSWDPQVHALARSRRVITYDVRDHGITEAPEDPSAYSQDISVEDLHGLLTHLKIRRAAIGKTHPFMADCIKGSTHLVLRNAGHLTNLEAPAAFNAAVKRSLGR
jgi:pimeloyl-ACP methyl ester carboxylesterase